jgi:hypothetical protein
MLAKRVEIRSPDMLEKGERTASKEQEKGVKMKIRPLDLLEKRVKIRPPDRPEKGVKTWPPNMW